MSPLDCRDHRVDCIASGPTDLTDDLGRAEASMGVQGRDTLSLVDAGAAAENMALAAVALGLATCFVRCANDTAAWSSY